MAEITKKKVEIPEQITIGETTFVVEQTPELQKLIKDIITEASTIAASQEKTKLYSNIQKLETDLAEAKKVANNVSLQNPAQNQKIEESTAKTNAEWKSFVEELKANAETLTPVQIADTMLKAFRESLPGIVKEQLEPVLKMVEENQKAKISSYREKRLKEMEGRIIPDLVKGNTPEEIEESIKESEIIFSKYFSKPAELNKPTETTVIEARQGVIAPENPPRRETPVQGASPDIKKMSQKDFEANRKNLEEVIRREASAYPGMGQQEQL